MKLTKSTIERLTVPSPGPNGETRQTFYRDDELTCFGVRVTSGGVKSFIVEKRVQGTPRRITLGRFGDELTAAQARQEALKLLGDIATGSNPIEQRRQNKAYAVTLGDIFREYTQTRKELKPNTLKDYTRIMAECFDDWRTRPLRSISKDMVEKRHAELGQRSYARANNSMRVLRALFNYAAGKYEDENGRTLFPENPVKRLSQTRAWYRVDRRQTYIKTHELPAWWKAVHELANKRRDSQAETVRDWLLLVLFTGLRKTEAQSLTWERVDLKGRTLTITDTKNHQTHVLPLSDFVFNMLEARHREASSQYVFPFGETYMTDPRRHMQSVINASGVQFCIHDLRRTFTTIAESLDISAYALKRLLNHKMGGDVTAGYIITDVERLRKPMQAIADYILSAAKVKPKAQIVELKQERING
jgi:integrase